MDRYLSLDIGGTKIAAAAMTRDGRVLARHRVPTRAHEGPGAVVANILAAARQAISGAPGAPARVGICIAGPMDPVAGIVDRPPNLPGWDRVPLRALVARGIGIGEDRVAMENDANACALAELRFGAARGRSHAVYLTMSTGIGGGLILNGRLYRGATFNAGEVGHQVVVPGGPPCGCGNRGCLEAVASGSGIAARMRAMFGSLPPAIRAAAGGEAASVTAEHLMDAARGGDPWARQFLAETMESLARGIANLVFVLNPEVVILGTMAYRAPDLLLEPLREAVGRLCWPVLTRRLEIVASPLGARIESLSGLAVALEGEYPDDRNPPHTSCPPAPASP